MSAERTDAGQRLPGWIVIYAKGVFMGAADAVPGVSGGTIALITGIYERLIAAITSLDPTVLQYVPRVHRRSGRTKLRAALIGMDVPFLVALGAGILTALVTVARIMQYAFTAYPGLVAALFFGLIAASAIVLSEHIALDTPRRIAVGIVGFVLAFLVSAPEVSSGLPNSPAFVFVAGAIAIAGMILPGISGAFFLYLLGQYEFLTGQLSSFVDGLIGIPTGGGIDAVIGPGIVVIAFGCGALVGLFSISYAIRWALAHYREATLTFLVSLMVGALRLPAANVLDATPAVTPSAVGSVVVVAIAGGALVFLVDRVTADIEYA